MKFRYLLPVLLVTSLALMGAACKPRDSNPIVTGCTAAEGQKVSTELCAFATYGSFVVLEGQATDLAEQFDARARATTDEATAAKYRSARDALIAAADRSKPVADTGVALLRQLALIRAEVDATSGQTKEERLLAATADLDRWLTQIGPLIVDLTTAVTKGDATP